MSIKKKILKFKEHLMGSMGIREQEFFEKVLGNTFGKFGLVKEKNREVKKAWKVKKEEKCKYFCVMKEILEVAFDNCVRKCEKLK